MISGSAQAGYAGHFFPMTPEERNGLKIFGLLVLIALLWIVGLMAAFRIARAMDDGMAAPPSAWRH